MWMSLLMDSHSAADGDRVAVDPEDGARAGCGLDLVEGVGRSTLLKLLRLQQ